MSALEIRSLYLQYSSKYDIISIEEGGDCLILHPVSSSRMNRVGWEDDVMVIEFRDGTRYSYMNVSYEEYYAFIHSPSLGSALSSFERRHAYHKGG
ncbi:MAG: KTSC domain-containing protein [Eubacteriales bacterium]